jgi:hypothetical protein
LVLGLYCTRAVAAAAGSTGSDVCVGLSRPLPSSSLTVARRFLRPGAACAISGQCQPAARLCMNEVMDGNAAHSMIFKHPPKAGCGALTWGCLPACNSLHALACCQQLLHHARVLQGLGQEDHHLVLPLLCCVEPLLQLPNLHLRCLPIPKRSLSSIVTVPVLLCKFLKPEMPRSLAREDDQCK